MMKFVRRHRLLLLLTVCGVILITAFALVFHTAIRWRLDLAGAFLRGVLYPVPAAPAGTGWDEGSGLRSAVQSDTAKNAPEKEEVPSGLPTSVVLSPPEFDPAVDIQDWNNCGPATLALGLRMYGWKGDQFTVSREIKPQQTDKNVSIDELANYVNTQATNLRAVWRVNNSSLTIRQFLAAGYPVIIEEAFKLEQAFWPNDDLWAAHYLLITGYDEISSSWIVQDSYYGPNRKLPMSVLEQSWQPFNRVMLVIYDAQDESTVHGIWGPDWDEGASWQRAEEAQRAVVQSDEKDAFAWFNLGSDLLAQRKMAEADQAFDRAEEIGLPQRMLRYQFGPLEAAYGAKEAENLIRLTNAALDRTPNSEELLYWKGMAYLLTGQNEAATRLFRRALDAHPGFEPALLALEAPGK